MKPGRKSVVRRGMRQEEEEECQVLVFAEWLG